VASSDAVLELLDCGSIEFVPNRQLVHARAPAISDAFLSWRHLASQSVGPLVDRDIIHTSFEWPIDPDELIIVDSNG